MLNYYLSEKFKPIENDKFNHLINTLIEQTIQRKFIRYVYVYMHAFGLWAGVDIGLSLNS